MMVAEVVSRWNGVFLVENGKLVRTIPIPQDLEVLLARLDRRRTGQTGPEEERLLSETKGASRSTHDRRLVGEGVTLAERVSRSPHPELPPVDRALERSALLAAAESALRSAWDPSIHVEEAVRATTDLDQVLNRVGERLASWSMRDVPVLDSSDVDTVHSAARRLASAEPATGEGEFGPADPELVEARRRLAQLYLAIDAARKEIESAVENALPHRAPNLSALLGPLLAARLLSQAGGLDRLSRLPASTIQVLGAERAFFEHLRGHAPPPRHGLLFLHPDIQGAPRRLRGKLSRALAGKVAIAARLDRAGTAVRPELLTAFQARRTAIRALPAKKILASGARRSRPPLDRATQYR